MGRVTTTSTRAGARIGLAMAALAALLSGPVRADEAAPPKPEPFAVLELFTSEGCSSCPPADAVLGRIARKGERESRRVFALSFHVDYWDRLGWPDPFASAAFTERQRRYARAFASTRVYTPQVVVNGRDELVGSRGKEVGRLIEAALATQAQAAVRLTRATPASGDDAVGVRYEVTGAPAGAVLRIALCQREARVEVQRGENGGRTLQHANVVRRFTTVALDKATAGEVRLELPKGLAAKDTLLFAYVQDPGTWAILGAASLDED